MIGKFTPKRKLSPSTDGKSGEVLQSAKYFCCSVLLNYESEFVNVHIFWFRHIKLNIFGSLEVLINIFHISITQRLTDQARNLPTVRINGSYDPSSLVSGASRTSG